MHPLLVPQYFISLLLPHSICLLFNKCQRSTSFGEVTSPPPTRVNNEYSKISRRLFIQFMEQGNNTITSLENRWTACHNSSWTIHYTGHSHHSRRGNRILRRDCKNRSRNCHRRDCRAENWKSEDDSRTCRENFYLAGSRNQKNALFFILASFMNGTLGTLAVFCSALLGNPRWSKYTDLICVEWVIWRGK